MMWALEWNRSCVYEVGLDLKVGVGWIGLKTLGSPTNPEGRASIAGEGLRSPT